MTGWTNQVEDKFLKLREREYIKKQQHPHKDAVFSRKRKGFVTLLGFLFVLVSLVGMLLICIAILSPKTIDINNPNGTFASLLWDYNLNSLLGLNSLTYMLSMYGITTIVFIILSVIILVWFTYAFVKDDSVVALPKKSKKLWFLTLFASTVVYIVFLVIAIVGVSIVDLSYYPTRLTNILQNDSFGLIFYINSIPTSSGFNLGVSGYGIFVVILQFLLILSSIVWFLGFNYSVRFSNLKNLFKKVQQVTKKTVKKRK